MQFNYPMRVARQRLKSPAAAVPRPLKWTEKGFSGQDFYFYSCIKEYKTPV